jgi:hypothetical protein
MTISLRLDAHLTRRLASVAKARGISKSELIRKCLDEYLKLEEQEPTAWELGSHLFGCFDSGQSDLSVRAKEIVRERTVRCRRRPSQERPGICPSIASEIDLDHGRGDGSHVRA